MGVVLQIATATAADEIEGLRAAYAADRKARTKRDSILSRLQTSREQQARGRSDRRALIARAASGEEVPGSELRRVDDSIRDSESSETLLIAALDTAEREVIEAERTVNRIQGAEYSRRQNMLLDEFRAAERRLEEARLALDAASTRARGGLPEDVRLAVRALFESHW